MCVFRIFNSGNIWKMNWVRSWNRASRSITEERKISEVRECVTGAGILSKSQTRYFLIIREDIPVVY